MAGPDPLELFAPPVASWFETSLGVPTEAQAGSWPAISSGQGVLLCAPTGSGKTLAAFLWSIDRLAFGPPRSPAGTRVLYISPLRALAVDVDKNLRAPLRGIELAAERLGVDHRPVNVGVRTGDTPADERRRLRRHPPDILITTPESLYLMLTSAARETLAGVETVIVDEIHAVASTKRGAHLALSLERLEQICEQSPQRIGLSATQRPLDEIAHFLGGNIVGSDGVPVGPRPIVIVDAGNRKQLDIEVVVPVEDMGRTGSTENGTARPGIWPSIHPRLLELIESHRSTLVFVNARRLAERLSSRLNELAAGGENRAGESLGASAVVGEELVKAHHGSLSREQRLLIEDELKRGELRGLVATSSLELGIDMGAVDLVIQVESPGSVSAGLQRIGRSGHQVGAPSRGRIFPKHRADLVETAVVVQRMLAGEIEHMRFLRNPLDVLAQQIVAATALDEWATGELLAMCRASAPYGEMTDELFHSVLDLLDGRYPSEEFSELRPRIVWDRGADIVRGRAGAQRLAVTNAGTIPDRGLFGVFLPDGTRVGELDEEMVYESRPGETFLLGASTWRIQEITHQKVIVTPAPGQPGKMPFWHGDGPGRPVELGRAIGAFVREIRAMTREDAIVRLQTVHRLDPLAADNLLGYLDEQAEATGVVPDDRTLVVERFRDEIGDWRICIHTPFGARVNAPWAIVLRNSLAAAADEGAEVMWSDDGIIIRLPESLDGVDLDDLLPDPDTVASQVVAALPGTALFASRFRECAGRALLLPRRRVGQRTPLWQQRQRAGDLLGVAAKFPRFPILLEATRECMNDVFDVPALVEVLTAVRSRKIRAVSVDTVTASPFAQSLLFSWIAVYMYEGDAPLAERRATALSLDRDLLHDLLGSDELRTLIDPQVLLDVEEELQRLRAGRRARDVDELHDLLRILGPLSVDELSERSTRDLDVAAAVDELVAARRSIAVKVAGDERVADAADAARLRDALGVAIPLGLPAGFTDPVEHPLQDLVERFARTHGPFTAAQVAARLGMAVDQVRLVLGGLEVVGRVQRGEFRPQGNEREWCDADVVRQIRRRTLAALRREVEPVEVTALGRFLPTWQGVGSQRRGLDALVETIALLQGAPLVASSLEVDVLSSRIVEYRSSDLDQLCTSGDLVWVGAGGIGANDGRVRLAFRSDAPLLIPSPGEIRPSDPHHELLRSHLAARGACFWNELVGAVAAAGLAYGDEEVLSALWDLVWSGEVTNDTLVPLRARLGAGRTRSGARVARQRPRMGRLAKQGPPAGAGRWSLVTQITSPTPSSTEVAVARATQLLERYGVLTREMALAESTEAGFAGVYPVLKLMEEQGKIRRGYFIAGLGAAQFARAGAVDQLRDARTNSEHQATSMVLLAATDPAQPFGAVLPWPDSEGRPSRSAGARVVIVDGLCAAFVERNAKSILLFDPGLCEPVADVLTDQLAPRARRMELASVNGGSIAESTLSSPLQKRGWKVSYRGLRPPDQSRH